MVHPMTQILEDTHPKIKQMQIEGYRRMSARDKVRSMRDLSLFGARLTLADICRRYPNSTESEQNIFAAARWVDPELLRKATSHIYVKRKCFMLGDTEKVMEILARTFEHLGVEYLVGGSVASSVHGKPRLTHDVDFMADVRLEHVPGLVAALEADFYVDGDMITDAIETQSSFNVLHLPTMVKGDVFLYQPTPWKQSEWERRRVVRIGTDEEAVEVLVASPEDMILQKLEWFRLGGGVSERQWNDVQGMLEGQSPTLEYDYMKYWAQELGLITLLEQAMDAAGV